MKIETIRITLDGVDYSDNIISHDPFVLRPIQDQTPYSYVLADDDADLLPAVVDNSLIGKPSVVTRTQGLQTSRIDGSVSQSSWVDGEARISIVNTIADYTSTRKRLETREHQMQHSLPGLARDKIYDEMGGSGEHADAELNWQPR